MPNARGGIVTRHALGRRGGIACRTEFHTYQQRTDLKFVAVLQSGEERDRLSVAPNDLLGQVVDEPCITVAREQSIETRQPRIGKVNVTAWQSTEKQIMIDSPAFLLTVRIAYFEQTHGRNFVRRRCFAFRLASGMEKGESFVASGQQCTLVQRDALARTKRLAIERDGLIIRKTEQSPASWVTNCESREIRSTLHGDSGVFRSANQSTIRR